jgi:hypothetical protein
MPVAFHRFQLRGECRYRFDDFFFPPFFFGTLAPFFLASESPMAIACFRLVTFLPLLPDFSVPFFFLRIALSTRFDAALPYFRPRDDFFAAMMLLPCGSPAGRRSDT